MRRTGRFQWSSRIAALALCAVLPGAVPGTERAGELVWRGLGPLDQGPYHLPADVTVLAIDPASGQTLYVGSTVFVPGMVAGVTFKSADAGRTWAILGNGINVLPGEGLPPPPVLDFAFDPTASTTVYATLQQGGVFKSTDAGMSWTGTNRGLSGEFVGPIAVDPFSPAILYAATSGDGVFKSEDSGASWRHSSAGLAFPFVLSLLADAGRSSTLFAGTLGNGVYQTTDAGSSWRPANVGLTEPDVHALAQAPGSPGRIYAGTGHGRVFRSGDGGATWTGGSLGVEADVLSLAVAPDDAARVYAGTRGAGVFVSSDGGATWTAINAGLSDWNAATLAIDPSSPRRVYVGTHAGIFVREEERAVPRPPERAPETPRPVGFR